AGICLGGDYSFQTALADKRVRAILMVNAPWMGQDDRGRERYEQAGSMAMWRNYRTKVFDPKSWRRLLTLKSDVRAIWRTMRALGRAPRRTSETLSLVASQMNELHERGVRVHLIYSQGSSAWDSLRLLTGADFERLSGGLDLCFIDRAD